MSELRAGMCVKSNDSRDGHRPSYWIVSIDAGRARLQDAYGGKHVTVSLHRIFDDNKPRLYGWSVVPDAGERPLITRQFAPDRKRPADAASAQDDADEIEPVSEPSSRETFGERLFRLRVERNLKAEQIAQRIGVTHPVIRRAESGEHMIRAHRLPDLARVLGVTVDYLLTGRDTDDALRNAILRGTSREILLAMARRGA